MSISPLTKIIFLQDCHYTDYIGNKSVNEIIKRLEKEGFVIINRLDEINAIIMVTHNLRKVSGQTQIVFGATNDNPKVFCYSYT